MINHLLLIASSLIIYEFVKYLRFNNFIRNNLKIYQKIIRLFKYKKASDFRKEKLIFNYSKSLFLVSLRIVVILICILVFMIILNLISNSYLNFIMSISGVIELSIVFLLYHLIRKKFNAKL